MNRVEMVISVDTLFMSERFRRTGTGIYLRQLLSEWIKLAEILLVRVPRQ